MSLFGRNDREDGGRGAAGASAAAADRALSSGPIAGASSPTTGGSVANIGKSIRFKGEMTGDEDLVIEGNVEGRVMLPNNQLTIGTNGTVKADVEGKSVVVVGHLVGNVTATERVEIQGTGVVDGDVRSPKLHIEEGAVLNGSVEMTGKSAQPSKPAAASPAPKAPQAGAHP